MTTGRRTVPQHDDLRREARRRLIVGVTGLGTMLLLVVLAGLLAGQARDEAAVGPGNAATMAAGDEPLATLGVTPTADTSAATDAAVAPAGPPALGPAPALPPASPPLPGAAAAPGATTPAGRVPDLQPDPQLQASQSAGR